MRTKLCNNNQERKLLKYLYNNEKQLIKVLERHQKNKIKQIKSHIDIDLEPILAEELETDINTFIPFLGVFDRNIDEIDRLYSKKENDTIKSYLCNLRAEIVERFLNSLSVPPQVKYLLKNDSTSLNNIIVLDDKVCQNFLGNYHMGYGLAKFCNLPNMISIYLDFDNEVNKLQSHNKLEQSFARIYKIHK